MLYIIQAVPERLDHVEYMMSRLPGARLYVDRRKKATTAFIRSMLLAGDQPHVHLQDDIWFVKDFDRKINEAVSQHPDDIINFYPGMSKAPWEKHWRTGSRFQCLPCTYFPANFSRGFAQWCAENQNGYPDNPEWRENADDSTLQLYLKSLRLKYLCWWPPLVQHRLGKSMLGHARGRQTPFVTEDQLDLPGRG